MTNRIDHVLRRATDPGSVVAIIADNCDIIYEKGHSARGISLFQRRSLSTSCAVAALQLVE